MGNFMNKQENDTINWNNIKTENMSSSAHFGGTNFNGISNEAKALIASLDIQDIMSSEKSEENLNSILGKINENLSMEDQQKFEELLTKESGVSAEELSATSPFVSSDMNDYFIKKNQLGGATKNDSSTSSTSDSDLDDKDLITTPESEIKHKARKNNSKKHYTRSQQSTDSSENQDLSYLSSSAHTGGEFSTEEYTDSEPQYKPQNEESSESPSVNTSDINYVDDD
jgi:hypothetical protein